MLYLSQLMNLSYFFKEVFVMEIKKSTYFHCLVVAFFCLGFRFLPPFMGLTEMGMGIMGTFIGAVYGWVLIDLLWPSVLALVGIGLSIGMNNMMTQSFGSLTIVMLIVCMMAVGAAMKNGAFNWLAMKLLTNKFMQGKAWTTLFIVFILAWLTGAFNPIIMCMIYCGFMTSMFQQCGVKKDDPLVLYTFLAISYQLMRGQILFPFKGTGLVYLNMYNNMFPNLPMPYGQYMVMMVIMGILMTFVLLALMKFVFRVDVSPLANFKLEGGCPKATTHQKQALILFVVFLFANIFATMGPLAQYLGVIGIVGNSMLIGAIVPLLKDENGKPLGDLEDLLHMVNWGQVMMVGYIMVVSTQMMAPATGISAFTANIIKPFMTLPPVVFIIVVMTFCMALTNVANNMLATVLCMPFMVNFATMIGMNPIGMVCLLFIISEFALATPAASPVTAVAMSQDYVTSNKMSVAGIKLVIPLFIVFMIVAWPLQGIIF